MMVRWDPVRELDALQQDVNRLFTDAFAGRRGRRGETDALWTPAVNAFEDKDAFVLSCDLPGLTREDVKLNLDNSTLTVSGTRKLEHEDNREGYQRVECVFGAFNRSFTLPSTVAAEKVEASMEDGVLRIRLPKREESKPRQIEVGDAG